MPIGKNEQFFVSHSHVALGKTAHDTCLCAVDSRLVIREEKEVSMEIWSEVKYRLQNDAMFLSKIITAAESCLHQCDPESK